MRKLITLLAVITLFITAFAAEVDWLIEDTEGEKGGTMFWSTTTDPKTLNPAWASDNNSNMFINMFIASLLSKDEEAFYKKPYLAKSYEAVNAADGGMDLTFNLRKGLKWSDGTPLTSEDVRFTFEDIYFKKNMSVNGNDGFTDEDGNLPTIKVIDDYTVVFHYNKPMRVAIGSIGSTGILPKHKLGQYADDPVKFPQIWTLEQMDDLVASGPFIFKEYREGVRLVFERNPYFFAKDKNGVQLPYLDEHICVIVQNAETEVLKFQAGELDFISVSAPTYVSLKEKESSLPYHTVIGSYVPGPTFVSFNFNSPKKEQRVWFRNVHFRKAVSYALNREAIIDSMLNGLGTPTYAPRVPGEPYYDKEFIDSLGYRYSLSKAKRELKEGGFTWGNDGKLYGPNGNLVQFDMVTNVSTTAWVEVGNILTDSLAKLGMEVNFRPLQFNTVVNNLMGGSFESVILRLSGETPDPNDGWNVYLLDGGLHFWNWSPEYLKDVNPDLLDPADYEVAEWERRIDEIYRLQKSELDDEKLRDMFEEWSNLEAQYMPMIYTFAQNSLLAVSDSLHLTSEELVPYRGVLWNIWTVWKDQ